jgi:hypothetical protein
LKDVAGDGKTSMPATEKPNASASRLRQKGRQIIRAVEGVPVLGSLFTDKSVRSGLFAFALTRAIVIFLFVVTMQIGFVYGPRPVGEFQEVTLTLHHIPFAQTMQAIARRADGNWYIGIATEGYERLPFEASTQHNWTFFPLYPLIVRLVSTVTGDPVLTGLALANIFLLLALILLHKTTLAFGYEEEDARRTVLYLAAFPTSYFFSLFMTESLFLLLVVASFYSARRERWWLAGVCGALASATRVSGILLLPVLAVLYWQQHGRQFKSNVLGLLIIPTGLLAFMVYLHSITGNAFAFKDVQVAWGRKPGLFIVPLLKYLVDPLRIVDGWDFKIINFLAAMLAFTCALLLLKRRQWALGLFTLACVILPLSSQLLQSLGRYVLVIFPVFMTLALMGRSPRVDRLVVALFFSLLTLMTILNAAHWNLAMS